MSIIVKKEIPVEPVKRIQRKEVLSKEDSEKKIIERSVRAFYNESGEYRYTIIFMGTQHTHKGRLGLYVTDREVNGIPYAVYNSVKLSEFKERIRIPYEKIPEKILNLVKKEIRNGKHL